MIAKDNQNVPQFLFFILFFYFYPFYMLMTLYQYTLSEGLWWRASG
jgi:hypothetical protein